MQDMLLEITSEDCFVTLGKVTTGGNIQDEISKIKMTTIAV